MAAALPELPFVSGAFDPVLCGHLLFSDAPLAAGGLMIGSGLDLSWHRAALDELCRVSCCEVRLYPAHTQTLPARRHPYAEALMADLPTPWTGYFVGRHTDQGFSGCTDGLASRREGGGSGAA